MGRKAYNKISKYKPSLFQGRFEFGVQRQGLSWAHEHPAERFVRHALVIGLLALGCLYLYFITSTVLNVIARKDALTKTATIEGSIGSLEQQYLALSKEVNASVASAVGLAPVSDTSYVYRPGTVGAATIEPNAI